MNPLALKALLGAFALLVPGAIGAGYAVTESRAATAPAANHAQELFGGEVLEAFTGEIAPSVTEGTLDFRTFQGTVYVASWDRAAFEVTVLYAGAETGERVSDAAVEVVFDDASTEDALALTLSVVRSGTYDLRLNDAGSERYAIVAFIPDLFVTELNACAGSEGGFAIPIEVVPIERASGAACIESAEPVGASVHLVGSTESDGAKLTAPFGLADLRVGEASLAAEYADLFVTNVQAASLALATEYGDVRVTDAVADALSIVTQYGDVGIARSDLAGLAAATEYGDVVVEATFLDGAEVEVVSGYGDVRVLVPGSSEFGYIIDAATEYGDVRIQLPDVEAGEEKEEDVGLKPTTLFALPRFATSSGADAGKERGERVHVETVDAGERENVVSLSLITQYGDILVGDLLMKEPAQ